MWDIRGSGWMWPNGCQSWTSWFAAYISAYVWSYSEWKRRQGWAGEVLRGQEWIAFGQAPRQDPAFSLCSLHLPTFLGQTHSESHPKIAKKEH